MTQDKNVRFFCVMLFLWGLILIGYALMMSGCTHPMPKVDVKVWAGDPSQNAIVRAQTNEMIECVDPHFNNYACLTYDDIRKLYGAFLQCKEWGPPVATFDEMKRMVRSNSEVIQHVTKKMESLHD